MSGVMVSMKNNGIKTIAILGGDCIAWSVAAILLRCSGIKFLRVVVVDSGGSAPTEEIKAMNPSLQKFHNLIGIDEKDFMLKTGATFRLANRYVYGDSQQAFTQSFGDHGVPFDDVDFHQHFIKSTECPEKHAYHSYSLGAVAAIKERFIQPTIDPRSIYSSFSYGYHLNAGLYRNYLREYVLTWGGEQLIGRYCGAKTCAETGFLRTIIMENGDKLHADFFIDCSGSEGMLIGKALNVPYEDFSQYVPVKNHMDVIASSNCGLKLSTLLSYKNNLWKKEIFLDGLRLVRFFSSSVIEEKRIEESIKQENYGVDSHFTKTIVSPGLRKFIWYKNCLSVGGSCAYLGEFGVDDLELSHFIAIKFLDFFPDVHCRPLNTAEFNRAITRECENIRDFNTLHYFMAYRKQSQDKGSASLILSAELKNNLDLFADSGVRSGTNDNLISRQQWISYLMEHEFLPKQSILLASLASDKCSQRFAHLRSSIERAANAMPYHQEYLTKYLSRNPG